MRNKIIAFALLLTGVWTISWFTFVFVEKNLVEKFRQKTMLMANTFGVEISGNNYSNGKFQLIGIAPDQDAKDKFIMTLSDSNYFTTSFQIKVKEPQPEVKTASPDVEIKPQAIEHEIQTLHLYFYFNKTLLKPREEHKLQKISEYLKDNLNDYIVISGHTDVTGTISRNDLLSNERCDLIEKFMINNGIDQTRVFCEHYADKVPLSNNGTKLGREFNRRIDITIKRKI